MSFNPTPFPKQGYVGRYTTETSLRMYLGTLNVQLESDTDSTGAENFATVAQCIASAEDKFDAAIQNSNRYPIPLQFTSPYINMDLRQMVNMQAGLYLAENGLIISATLKTQIANWKMDIEAWLKAVWYGDVVILGAAQTANANGNIFTVRQTRQPSGLPMNPAFGGIRGFGSWGR